MKLTKSLASAGLLTAVAVAVGSFGAVGAVNATTNNPHDSLIDKIVTETGADRAKVEAAFESHHEEMLAQRQAEQTERLEALVSEGKITAEQKAALEAKFEELHAKRKELKDQDLTREQMHEQMKTEREALKAWAEEQGIDLDVIRPERGHGFGYRGHGPFGGMHGDAATTDDAEN